MQKVDFLKKLYNFIEALAYPLALWNVLLLFFEPIVGYYFNLEQTQNWTAFINLLFIITALIIRFIYIPFSRHRNRTIADVLILGFGSLLFVYDEKFVVFFLLVRQIFYIAQYFFLHAFEGAVYKKLVKNPPVTFLSSFAITIFSGTMLLMLPSATVSNKVTPFVDALFTATSATCVTGLTVVDTGTHFSVLGQLIILVLIQVGGLGIMTISTAFAVMLGQKLTLKFENVMHNVIGERTKFDVLALIKNVVLLTFTIEFAGALVLFYTFKDLFSPSKALYYSVFHSISAFCNAGFSLYSDSFSRFVSNLSINFVVTILIIVGGIGFSVISDIYNHIFRKNNRYSLTLHTKVVLSITVILLIFGTIAFFVSEYNYTMKGYSLYSRLMASWFQSVTCRTAGFNTIDQSQISNSTSLVSMILMFIGASPGSTGGGIKTTTFALLLLSIISLIKGQFEISIFKRKISANSIRESTGLITLSLVSIFIIVYVIMLIDSFPFEKVLFEAISAFGTVGLSTGITPFLSTISKFLIIMLMYIGRVGPLTVLFALSLRKKVLRYTYAEERIAIG